MNLTVGEEKCQLRKRTNETSGRTGSGFSGHFGSLSRQRVGLGNEY